MAADRKPENGTIIEKNLVLVNVPAGKRYLGAHESIPHTAKFGVNCWYYLFNFLRPRIGKIEKQLEKFQNEPTAQLFLKKRNIEKILSQHRKSNSVIYNTYGENKPLVNFCKTKAEAKDVLQKLKEYKDENESKESFRVRNQNIAFLTEFINQDENGLEKYLEDKFMWDHILVAKNTLKKLGLDPLEELNKIKKIVLEPGADPSSSLKNLYLCYHSAVVKAAREGFHLKSSNWNPRDGFDSLMKILGEEGAIGVNARIGRVFYLDPPTFSSKIGSYEIYYWPKGSKQREIGESHGILIVGAQRIPTQNGLQNTVLFLDPADESQPGQPNKIYRLSYDLFLKNLKNIHGKSPDVIFSNGPFAMRTDVEYKKELENKFTQLMSR